MHRYFRFIFYTLFILATGGIKDGYSQIHSSTPYTDTTVYTEGPQDVIYIFYKDNEAADDAVGRLTASDPTGCDTCDFTWYSFDYYANAFSATSFATGTNVLGLITGGYKVDISNHAGYDTSFIAWVFVTYLNASVSKDTEGNVTETAGGCDCLDLEGFKSHPESYAYFDSKAGNPKSLVNDITIVWTYNPDKTEAALTDADELQPSACRPPYFNVTYTMNVYDKYKYASTPVSDEVLYESEIPKAIIEDEDIVIYDSHYENATNKEEHKGGIGVEMSAPARATFMHHSENLVSYTWVLVDTAEFAYDPNYIIQSSNIDTTIEYTYYIPKDYYIKLIVYSEEGCTDTLDYFPDKPIKIRISGLVVPNVIYPDNEKYCCFMLENESIKSLRVRIFDRWGKKIYEYEGDINNWNGGKGWDGTIKDSNREAPSGIYFYVIEAKGWDNVKWKFPNDSDDSKQNQTGGGGTDATQTTVAKGTFYLFRNSK